MKKINVYNISKLPVKDFSELKPLQDNFKVQTPEQFEKLKNIIIKRGFKYPFIVWNDNGIYWINDGHQRQIVLTSLKQDGYDIAPVPYFEVKAKDKKEAIEEIAAINSKFATINPDSGLFNEYEIDIGTFNVDGFEVKYDKDQHHEFEVKKITPYKKTHILLSFDPQKIIELQPLLDKILKLEGIEYEQASN